ncbi:ABC-2 type transport system ATP-binding protein [Methanococcoides vulcani]|uniref:ABC-2 type transport system ATP-binding protein n=1 Tax=Methanococcoides vulcani TaxID=1353158 RepID=A0A1I0BNW2_9EURY|nr:ABC transporter ATP-binding protein [Methanococcoides vulcani]SET08669.1 ABC-2 type transport system ATP-binding protein [Methanococcoides vulcani]
MTDDAIITVEDLSKQYDGFMAVEGVSFDIKRGEIFGLLGPNGAGKSTIISILCCLLEPTAGRVTIDGFDVEKNATDIKKIIGVVPQEISLYYTLTARENLAFYAKIYGLSGKAMKDRIEELLDMVGLTDRADDRLEGYSGGMKRRINIAVALLHNPRILFLDEPSTGVDPQSRKRIYDTIRDLNRQGTTVLLTTHQMEDAEKLCHRIAIMDKGKLVALDTLQGLLKLVGESDIIQVTSKELPPEAADTIQQIDKVQKVAVDGGSMTIGLVRGRESLAGIIDILIASGTKVESIQIKEPDLETLFLHLTGTRLRR